jgi:NAD+ synthase
MDIRPSSNFIETLYRFSDSLDQVNWRAKAKIERGIIEEMLFPSLTEWLSEAIRKVSYGYSTALVSLSGGIDSSTVAYITAEALLKMRRPRSLVLLYFNGNYEEDDKYVNIVVNDMVKRYNDDIDISFVSYDIQPILKTVHASVSCLVEKTGRQQVYVGELPTRVINQHAIELADRIGHTLVGSTNATEFVLGEFVLGCQEQVSPFLALYKSVIYELARVVNVPEEIINRPPVNSTWNNDKVRTYFKEMPNISAEEAYNVLDPVLYGLHDLKLSPPRVARELRHSLSFVSRVYNRITSQEHRRRIPLYTPITIQVRYPSALPSQFRGHERRMIYERAKGV